MWSRVVQRFCSCVRQCFCLTRIGARAEFTLRVVFLHSPVYLAVLVCPTFCTGITFWWATRAAAHLAGARAVVSNFFFPASHFGGPCVYNIYCEMFCATDLHLLRVNSEIESKTRLIEARIVIERYPPRSGG